MYCIVPLRAVALQSGIHTVMATVSCASGIT
jgi:hypothetical protein